MLKRGMTSTNETMIANAATGMNFFTCLIFDVSLLNTLIGRFFSSACDGPHTLMCQF